MSSRLILYGLKRIEVEENGISVRTPHPISLLSCFLCSITNCNPSTPLAAYFTQATIDQLGTIDNISRVRDVVVAEGTFKSTRVGRRAIRGDEENRTDVRGGTRKYTAFPLPPYQQHSGTPNTNPVLMHEPYQQRQQQRTDQHDYFRDPVAVAAAVEPPPPYSQRTPNLRPTSSSPTATTAGNSHYYGDLPYYSGPSRHVRSNSYIDRPTTKSHHGDSSPYSPRQYHQPTTTSRAHASTTSSSPHDYSNNLILSPPWGNHDSYYYTRPIHSGPSSPPHSSTMSSYNHNHSNNNHNISSSSQHASPNYTKSYTPSYSLESALTPPHHHHHPSSSSSTLDRRGVTLASLQIPHYNTNASTTTTTQCHTPPDSAIAMEDPSSSTLLSSSKEEGEDQSGLAPLDELKRSRYRREPSDERTLRLLISSQSSSP